MAQLLSSANCHTVSEHQAPYLKLLREVEGNGVVLLSCFEVITGLHKCNDWSGHADLCIVNIVARNVFEQFLQRQVSVNIGPSLARCAQPLSEREDSKAYRESFGDGYLKVGPLNSGSYKLGCRTKKDYQPVANLACNLRVALSHSSSMLHGKNGRDDVVNSVTKIAVIVCSEKQQKIRY
jgi:hypothetical protein